MLVSPHNRGCVTVILCAKPVSLNQHVYDGNKKLSAGDVEVCCNSYGRNLQSWWDFLGIFGNPAIALWFFNNL